MQKVDFCPARSSRILDERIKSVTESKVLEARGALERAEVARISSLP